MNRRSFLKRGLLGGALLAVGGLGLWPSTRRFASRRPLKLFDERRFAIVAAIAARTVHAPGADPVEIAHRVDDTLNSATPDVQGDFKQLLLLFDNALAGLVLDGHLRPFTALSGEEQDAVLLAWRDSRLVLRRGGYHALRKLTLAAHYSQPSTWSSVGYPGPPTLSVPT
jgi:hypothetical protein